VTSKNKPDYDIELNEAWVMKGGPQTPPVTSVTDVKSYREAYPDGKPKAEWRAGYGPDHQYLLEGLQTFYYENGKKQWEAHFSAGHRVGTETWWDRNGQKMWEKSYAANGAWTWHYGSAESRWQGKELVDAKF